MPRRAPRLSAEAVIAAAKASVPRLWNAKRRIKSGRILSLGYPAIKKVGSDDSQAWKQLVSEDVVEFIEKAKLRPNERLRCLNDPNRYFSFPNNVPTALRKQVYFPNFNITFKRTPNLPPKYAAFDVPLWFNKLDMKDYLRSVYGVEVVHVRSAVFQAKIKRKDTRSPYSNGQLYRPASRKKMTVELVEPFIWPEPEEDLTPWDPKTYYDSLQSSIDANKKRGQTASSQPDKQHRKSIAEQAKDLLAGKTAWKSTWESFPTDSRVLKPFDPKKLGKMNNSSIAGRSVSAPR